MTLPTYSERKRKGNIGEAFSQYVLSSFCLVHKIDGSNDLGNDFICELIKNSYPTNILFYVQVKFWENEPHIRPETLEYWKGSPIPVFVFWVCEPKLEKISDIKPNNIIPGLKYKRFTPIVHGNNQKKVKKFKEFILKEFIRDLFVDYTRCQYIKGQTPVIKKSDFTEIESRDIFPFGEFCLFVEDVIQESIYKKNIINNSWSNFLSLAVIKFKEYKKDGDIKKLKEAWIFIKNSKKMLEENDYYSSVEKATLKGGFIFKYKKEIEEELTNKNCTEWKSKTEDVLGS